MFAGHVRSLVYLRNRCAHGARIWNHSVVDAPALLPTVATRTKRRHEGFQPVSVDMVLAVLVVLLRNSGLEQEWLSSEIDPILDADPELRRGIVGRERRTGGVMAAVAHTAFHDDGADPMSGKEWQHDRPTEQPVGLAERWAETDNDPKLSTLRRYAAAA